MRPTALLLALTAATAIVGCDQSPPRRKPTTVATQPKAADYYSKLLQLQLVDANPIPIQAALSCEVGRLTTAFGPDEAEARIRGVNDSVVQTPAEVANMQRVAKVISLSTFPMTGPVCDSVNALASRDYPITPIAAPTTSSAPAAQPK